MNAATITVRTNVRNRRLAMAIIRFGVSLLRIQAKADKIINVFTRIQLEETRTPTKSELGNALGWATRDMKTLNDMTIDEIADAMWEKLP